MSDLKMPYLNTVILAGRLVADPHPLNGAEGRVGAALTLAVNRFRPGKANVTTFVELIAWGQPAEAAIKFCAKGSAVLVHGALAQYERKNGKGPTTKTLQVSVVSLSLLDRKVPDESDPED